MTLSIDAKQADQNIRGSVALPKGIGKSKRVVAFCSPDAARAALEAAMEQVMKAYPEDTEAATLYALVLSANFDPTDRKYTNQLKAAAILEPIFLEKPRDHWTTLFATAGIPSGAIRSVGEVCEAPQLAARGRVDGRGARRAALRTQVGSITEASHALPNFRRESDGTRPLEQHRTYDGGGVGGRIRGHPELTYECFR